MKGDCRPSDNMDRPTLALKLDIHFARDHDATWLITRTVIASL
jgi:hypothetical protein